MEISRSKPNDAGLYVLTVKRTNRFSIRPGHTRIETIIDHITTKESEEKQAMEKIHDKPQTFFAKVINSIRETLGWQSA